MRAIRSDLNLDIRFGNRNQLGVTRRNQTGSESGPKLDLFFCSHENRTVRYRIVPISGSLFRTAQFLDLFWNGPLDFFCTRVNATPLCTTFWNGPKWNGTIQLFNINSVILEKRPSRRKPFKSAIQETVNCS